jgi:hypothetical protein
MDLDIRNYSPSELRTFFNLKPDQPYTASDIELRAYEIRERLVSGNHIQKGQVRQFITFMALVTAALIADKEPKQPHQPSSTHAPLIIPSIPYNAPNEIYVKTQTRLVSIDTRFRENAYTTTSSNFTISLPTKLSKVVTMELASFELSTVDAPNIYKSIRNNFFVIRLKISDEYHTQTTIEHTVIVPDGYYATVQQLFEAIRESLVCSSDELEIVELFESIQLEVNPISGQVEIFTTHCKIQSIELDFSKDEDGNSDRKQCEYYTKLGRVLGFTVRKYSGKTHYCGETRVDMFLCSHYFYLEIADFQNQYAPTFLPAFSNMNMSPSVIAKIVRKIGGCGGGGGDNGCIDNVAQLAIVSEPRVYFGPTDITRFQVRVLDVYGNVLDLMNADYSITLRFRYMYDSTLIK